MYRRDFMKLLSVLLLSGQGGSVEAEQSAFLDSSCGMGRAQSGPLEGQELVKLLDRYVDSGKRKLIVHCDVHIKEPIVIPSEFQIVFNGIVYSSSPKKTFFLVGARSTTVIFRSIVGNEIDENQSGFVIENSSDCAVFGENISGFFNKGVDILAENGGVCERNSISIKKISGARGKFGAAVSIYGRGSRHNTISGGLYIGNRVGITINGADYNKVIGSRCEENREAGIMLDGMISLSGDGASFNALRSIVCDHNGTGSDGYAGIYFGNGASNNKVESARALGNRGAGCKLSGASGTELKSNIFTDMVLRENQKGGFVSSWAPNTEIRNGTIESNEGKGVHLFNCDDSVVSGRSRFNGGDGLLIQSHNAVAEDLEVSFNNGYGIHLTFGGLRKPSLTLENVDMSGNKLGRINAPKEALFMNNWSPV